MTTNEVKHQAGLTKWKKIIMTCRGSGLGVKQWCAENNVVWGTYYRWEREIFGPFRKEGVASVVPDPPSWNFGLSQHTKYRRSLP